MAQLTFICLVSKNENPRTRHTKQQWDDGQMTGQLKGVCKYYIGPIGPKYYIGPAHRGVSLMSAATTTARSRPMGLGGR